MFSSKQKPSTPKTTPECTRLMKIVLNGLNANPFFAPERKAARAAMKRLCKKRCAKAIEYIIQVSCGRNPLDAFANEICRMATECLEKMS